VATSSAIVLQLLAEVEPYASVKTETSGEKSCCSVTQQNSSTDFKCGQDLGGVSSPLL